MTLGDTETLGFSDGVELGALDFVGAPVGTEDEKVGCSEGEVLGSDERLGE